jgi:hypothetical protein
MSTNDASTYDNSRIATETLAFANSTVTLNPSATDPIARVEHDTGATEFIGPLDDATIAALREVADE